MVAPSALAETVTPPILSPAADVMVPNRSASARTSAVDETSAATRPASVRPARFMKRLPCMRLIGSARRRIWRHGRRSRNGLQVGRDGGDLRLVEMVLEPGHARRAVGEHLAHHAFLPAERVLRQRRPELHRRELRLEMTDAARLHKERLAELLRLVERGLLGEERRVRGGEQHESKRDTAHYLRPPGTIFARGYASGGGRERALWAGVACAVIRRLGRAFTRPNNHGRRRECWVSLRLTQPTTASLSRIPLRSMRATR